MAFLPYLNINKHPSVVKDGTMVDAMNMIISKDNAVIHTEYGTTINQDIIDKCKRAIDSNIFDLKFIIPCNTELVLVLGNSNGTSCSIVRYDEETKQCWCCVNKYEYSGGEVSCTFTYNRSELIIAIAEIGTNGNKIPLKVINLGEFGKHDERDIRNEDKYFPICPEVHIPKCEAYYVDGIARKGWYYIFVRYKLDSNNYTPWYNTNESILVDSFAIENFFNVFTSKDAHEDKNFRPYGFATVAQVDVSDNTDIAKCSFQCIMNSSTGEQYKEYQLGFVCVSKTYTKGYRSNDIPIDTNAFSFKREDVIEHEVLDFIKNYNNYYNVHSVVTANNRLYIGNYSEQDLDNNIKTAGIKLDIKGTATKHNVSLFSEAVVDSDESKIVSKSIYGGNDNNKLIDEGNNITNKDIKKQDIRVKIPGLKGEPIHTDAIYRNGSFYITGDNFIIETDDGNYMTAREYFHDDVNASFLIFYKNALGIFTYTEARIKDLVFNPSNKIKPYAIVNRDTFDKATSINDEDWIKSDIDITHYKLVFPGKKVYELLPPKDYNDHDFRVYFGMLPEGFRDIDVFIGVKGAKTSSELHYSIKIKMSQYQYATEDYYNNHKNSIDNSNKIIDKDEYSKVYNANKLFTNVGFIPNERYNLFVHFVDKYGSYTRGIPISQFGVKTHFINNGSVELPIEREESFISITDVKDCFRHYNLIFSISDFPKGYIGYFVSYEKLEPRIKHKGVVISDGDKTVRFYNDDLNYRDKLDFKFDKVVLYKTNKVPRSVSFEGSGQAEGYVIKSTDGVPRYMADVQLNADYSNYKQYNIMNKQLRVADGYNNILTATNILIDTDEKIDKGEYIAHLIKSDYSSYKNKDKRLTPCSPVCYNTGELVVNPKNGFISKVHAVCYDINGKVLYNNATKTFNSHMDNKVIDIPIRQFTFYDYFEIPHEVISFNNKPDVTFFPNKGLNTTNERERSYYVGCVVECKNTVDLYQQKNFSVQEANPKILSWRNPDNRFTDRFDKTIRRSNTIQDESFNIRWRRFNQEDYKNIIENKGSITKLITFGNIFFVHTKHSMFEFNDTDTIKSNNGDIQLANIDIWDIKYRELLTSDLGYAGLKHSSHSIDGQFGYIFYDYDSNRFYRYDDGQFKAIDEDIRCYSSLYGGAHDVKFVDDKNNNRLLIYISKGDKDDVISYNYEHNKFISRHSYRFDKGYNTKSNTYIVKGNNVVQFDDSKFVTYDGLSGNKDSNAYVQTITNAGYYDMKFVEYIKYKLHQLDRKVQYNSINYWDSPVEKPYHKYAADYITINSEYCSTGRMDVSITDYNTFDDYTKPYFRLGDWYLNLIRDGIVKYNNHSQSAFDSSRIYGNWFAVKFEFNKGRYVEFENVEYKLSKDISE